MPMLICSHVHTYLCIHTYRLLPVLPKQIDGKVIYNNIIIITAYTFVYIFHASFHLDNFLYVYCYIIQSPCCCSKNIRFYRYKEGDSFGKHIDESHYDEEFQGESKLTLLIYVAVDNSMMGCESFENFNNDHVDYEYINALNSSLEGGWTLFYKVFTLNYVILHLLLLIDYFKYMLMIS